MRKLVTIQKRAKLNAVYSLDGKGNGGAYHWYRIDTGEDPLRALEIHIPFQNGPRGEEESVEGVIDSDLLEIVRDRLIAFQEGPFATRENAQALVHIEEALMWLNRRVEDRIERNVLGTNQE